jgi:hypothetical protein
MVAVIIVTVLALGIDTIELVLGTEEQQQQLQL